MGDVLNVITNFNAITASGTCEKRVFRDQKKIGKDKTFSRSDQPLSVWKMFLFLISKSGEIEKKISDAIVKTTHWDTFCKHSTKMIIELSAFTMQASCLWVGRISSSWSCTEFPISLVPERLEPIIKLIVGQGKKINFPINEKILTIWQKYFSFSTTLCVWKSSTSSEMGTVEKQTPKCKFISQTCTEFVMWLAANNQ